MKKALTLVVFMAFIFSGCSKTWSGIKQDSHEVFQDTKRTIHKATAS